MPDDRVEAQPLQISEETLLNLEDNLLFFTRSITSVNFIVIFRWLWPLVSRTFHPVSDEPVAKCLGIAMYSGAYD